MLRRSGRWGEGPCNGESTGVAEVGDESMNENEAESEGEGKDDGEGDVEHDGEGEGECECEDCFDDVVGIEGYEDSADVDASDGNHDCNDDCDGDEL